MLPVSKQDSCAANDECISLCTVGNRQVLFDQESSSCNVSRFTGLPQSSSWISWIATEQSVDRRDVRFHRMPSDRVNELKVVCASDERRHDSLQCERQRSEADGTSQCGEVTVSQTDSAASFLTSLQQLSDVVVDDWLVEDNGSDTDTRLKLEDARHLRIPVQLSTCESPMQCTS